MGMTLVRPSARQTEGEEGSILLLTLGYALLALAVLIVCVSATDLYIAQKRLDALADSAALAGASGYTLVVSDGVVSADLTDAGIREQAAEIVAALDSGAALVLATTPDGVTAQVTVSAEWYPPLVSLFVPDGVRLQATATSRTALR